jgi:type IV secretion system protein VirD4
MLQYIAQTFEKYTHDEAQAFTNIKTKIAFTPDSYEDAAYISKLLGTKTQKVTGGSCSSHDDWRSSTTANYNFTAASLMRPEQIMRLSSDKAIVVCSSHFPVKAKQCIWYKEFVLKNLPCGGSFVPEQIIEQVGFERLVGVDGGEEKQMKKETDREKIEEE